MHVMKWMGMAMVVGAVCVAHAGDIDSLAAPGDAGSAMYTLEDVYNRLDAGTAGAKRTGAFAEPSAGPGSSGHTVDEIMAKAPGTNANAAAAGDVLTGKVFWGLQSGIWGQQAGTVPAGANVNGADGSLVVTVTDGLYSGSKTATASDTDLVTGNIKAGVNLFGVAGDADVVNTGSGDAVASDIATGKKAWVDGEEVTGTASISAYPALVPKTGQTTPYATGDDGDLEPGVAWPGTRFTDNSDGTVTDNLTGLIWLKNANAFGSRTWANALTDCATLNSGEAGLTDGSAEGDWRLPNRFELESLLDLSRYNPPLPSGHPFTGVQLDVYWSSTTYAGITTYAWYVFLNVGYVSNGGKAGTNYVWPVRGGE